MTTITVDHLAHLDAALDDLAVAAAALRRAAMTVEAELVAAAADPDADAVSAIVDRLGDLAPIAVAARITHDVRRTVGA